MIRLKFVFWIRNIYNNPKVSNTNCKIIFLNKKKIFFSEFLKIIGVQIQLPIIFFLDLVCNKIWKVIYSTPTHTQRWQLFKQIFNFYKEKKIYPFIYNFAWAMKIFVNVSS